MVLGLMSIGAAFAGTPSFLKEQYGFFIGVDDFGPRAIVATLDGYVAVGDDAAGNAVVWLSGDGDTWSRAPHADILENLEMYDAIFTQFGIVMVGQDQKTSEPVALVSADGIRWRRGASFGPDAKPIALASVGPTLVLIGNNCENNSEFWYADSPSTWMVGDPSPDFNSGTDAVDVVSLDGGFLAAKQSGSDRAILFTSESGQTWSEVVRIKDAEMSSLARYRQGAVAVGYDRGQHAAAVWVSADGASWIQSPVVDALKESRMDVIVSDGAMLFAFGCNLDDDAVIVWTSEDGRAWERIPVSFGDVLIRDAIFTDSGIIAVGVDPKLNAAAFWTSADGITWLRAPHVEGLFTIR